MKKLDLGLVRKKEVWRLTLRGWISAFIIFGLVLLLFSYKLQPFLAISKPVKCEVMVVEGWFPDHALQKIAEEFKIKKYRLLVVTGGPLDQGYFLSGYKNYADLGAETLKRLGLDTHQIIAIPAPYVARDRTYAAAKALKTWIDGSGLPIRCINLYSLGAHARRSWLLFEKALGGQITVGVVALEDRRYDPRYWWKSSSGVREVISETIAYGYARLFFSSFN
ncbi:MAG: YdcF family protein [Desulfobaccales bacterium]